MLVNLNKPKLLLVFYYIYFSITKILLFFLSLPRLIQSFPVTCMMSSVHLVIGLPTFYFPFGPFQCVVIETIHLLSPQRIMNPIRFYFNMRESVSASVILVCPTSSHFTIFFCTYLNVKVCSLNKNII